MSDFHKLSGYQVSQKIKNQEISAVDYIDALIERIDKIDLKINSFITKNYEYIKHVGLHKKSICLGKSIGRDRKIKISNKKIMNISSTLGVGSH